MKLKQKMRLLWYRVSFYSENKTLISILFIGLINVLIMDLYLKKIPAPFEIMYIVGNILYNLCYAYFASFIFYYVTVTVPKKKRQLTMFRFIHNKIHKIETETMDFINTSVYGLELRGSLNDEKIVALTEDKLNAIFLVKNPHAPVLSLSIGGAVTYKNWYVFLDQAHKSIKDLIIDVLHFEDLVDDDVIESIANIEDIFSQHLNRTKGAGYNEDSMKNYTYNIIKLRNITRNMMNDYLKSRNKVMVIYDDLYRKRKRE